jgi:hypothetical protein
MAEAAITPFSIEFDPLLQQLKNHRQLVESAVACARFHGIFTPGRLGVCKVNFLPFYRQGTNQPLEVAITNTVS